MRTLALAALLFTVSTGAVLAADAAPDNYWPKDARIYIISPKSGAKVTSPVTIKFGHKGLDIAPAGDKTPNTGHFHLLIDQGLPSDLSVPLPANDNILHYGKAQTEATLDATKLPPGKHTLQLVMGDGSHIPHSPALVSKKITITVE
ncbi:MAG TPA: DUF4399 domain-containing protein [Steroidobacteraceae bacterium]|jgi:hypothetical protein|nr:DUF4399 domain-containing protein [Steroidobacteraceae bacterium]